MWKYFSSPYTILVELRLDVYLIFIILRAYLSFTQCVVLKNIHQTIIIYTTQSFSFKSIWLLRLIFVEIMNFGIIIQYKYYVDQH